MRRLSAKLASETIVHETLKSKLHEQLYLYEGGLKQTAAAKIRTQEKQVEENMLRLKVDNLSKSMAKENKQIYNLQRFKVELQTAMEERLLDINASRDILIGKKRNVCEEIGRLKSDIGLRVIRVEQFQKKYFIAVSLLGTDEEGQPLSVTTLKIRSAQEKFMLQQEGDALDKKIRIAEKEIIAMENTLKIVNYTNENFKNSLKGIEEEG